MDKTMDNKLLQDYLIQHGGYGNEDFVVETPVLTENVSLTPEQTEATLDYFVTSGSRLSQMTKTYHDVEAVTALLQEKEKDLELAAKIGQELLERNKHLDHKVTRLEAEIAVSQELITQLKHELQIKTDLLHVYTSDLEESTPHELKSINVELLQRKIQELEEDNRSLHAEASKLAAEAYKCEEKEEKLVTDAVKHLTEANIQIKDLHSQFTHKIDESSRQREEINMLLAQVCELQGRVQRYSHENDDLTANLRVYQETQDELTTELSDLKEKYREVVELLRDAQDQLRNNRKRTYPGMGKHNVSGMFSFHSSGGQDDSLQAELNSSLLSKKSSRTHTHSFSESRNRYLRHEAEISDSSDAEIPMSGSSSYRKAARTYKAIARSSSKYSALAASGSAAKSSSGGASGSSGNVITPGKSSVASAFESYTISRENSFSPDFEDFEFAGGRSAARRKFDDEFGASDDSGHGRSTEMSDSLSSSAPRDEYRARELLRQATSRNRQLSAASSNRQLAAVADARSVASLSSKAASLSGKDEHIHQGEGSVYEDGSMSDRHSVRASSPGPISALAEFFTPEYMVSAISRTTKSASTTALYPGISTSMYPGGVQGSGPAMFPGGLTRAALQQHTAGNVGRDDIEVVEVPTVGQLRRPSFQLSTTLLQATPLGVVPGRNGASVLPQPEPHGLGTVPTRRFIDTSRASGGMGSGSERLGSTDFDETEPLGVLTVPSLSRGGSRENMSGSVESLTTSPLPIPLLEGGNVYSPQLGNTPQHRAAGGGHPGLGQMPGGHPGFGQIPGGHPGFGQLPGGHPGFGQLPGGHPGFGQLPGGHPGFGQLPGGHTGIQPLLSSQASTTTSITTSSSLAMAVASEVSQGGQTDDFIGGDDELMQEFGGGACAGLEAEELEPTQSMSITSSSFSRRIDCQILGVDPYSEALTGSSQVPTELQSLHGLEDWSYSELREAGDIQFEELGEEFIVAPTAASASSGGARARDGGLAVLRRTSAGASCGGGEGGSGFGDSGVISGDYSELSNINRQGRLAAMSGARGVDVDALSDGGFCEMGTYPGIMVTEDSGLPPELASTLRYLNPADVERRRKALRADSISEFGDSEVVGFDSDLLPYGVNMDTTGFSDNTFNGDNIISRTTSFMGSSHSRNSGLINRLPDKLRIVKPLEGSLTLHNWSKLATPHLGGVLEERVGVAIKGNEKAGLDTLFDIYSLEEEDYENTLDGEKDVPNTVKEPTLTFNTLTNSTVLHPEITLLSSSYGSVQMSTGKEDPRKYSRSTSMLSSRRNSVSEPGSREGVYCVSTNLGLAKILEQKKISGVRRSQLDLRHSFTGSSLTPSVLSYPGSRNLSPTGTPPHTPEESLPGSPEESSGLVYSFFASLKSAIYGEQRKQNKQSKRHRRGGSAKLGIMEAVTEVGVENILLSDRESTPGSLPGLELEGYNTGYYSSKTKKPTLTKSQSCLSDFDARYLGALDDFDELEEIEPGSLTINGTGSWNENEDYTAAWIGQLTLPSYTVAGRPAMDTTQLGKVPDTQDEMRIPVHEMGGRGPGRIMAPGEIKPHHLSGLGVPAHPGSGAVRHRAAANRRSTRRKDLGTIPGFRHRTTVETTPQQSQFNNPPFSTAAYYSTTVNYNYNSGGGRNEPSPPPANEGFIGSVASMFFGRKGGYL